MSRAAGEGNSDTRAATSPRARKTGYLADSQQPLTILLFLGPLLVAYELGALVYLSAPDGSPTTIAAWGMLSRVFETFGVVGLHLPAVLLITVLFIWHVLQRDAWVIRPRVLIGMAMESCLWTVPLTILLIVIENAMGRGSSTEVAAMVQTSSDVALRDLPWQTRLTISAGAGLYEELVFRMILIAAAHTVLVDVMQLSNKVGGTLAVIASAAAFAAYHQVSAGGDGIAWAIPYFAAGLFFGGLYLVRGFGIVVAVHFLYDVVALLVSG